MGPGAWVYASYLTEWLRREAAPGLRKFIYDDILVDLVNQDQQQALSQNARDKDGPRFELSEDEHGATAIRALRKHTIIVRNRFM